MSVIAIPSIQMIYKVAEFSKVRFHGRFIQYAKLNYTVREIEKLVKNTKLDKI